MRTKDYTVVEFRQAWRIAEGAYWREAVIRRANGVLRLAYVFDGRLGQ